MMPQLAPIFTCTPVIRRVTGTMPFLRSRDCYSPPAECTRVAKARGMDLVAFTDHDSIDGALELLNDRPDCSDRRSSAKRCRAGFPMTISRCTSPSTA